MFIPGSIIYLISVIIISFGFGRAWQHKFSKTEGMLEIFAGSVLSLLSMFIKW